MVQSSCSQRSGPLAAGDTYVALENHLDAAARRATAPPNHVRMASMPS